MVTRVLAIVLLAGCLSKPDLPSLRDGGVNDGSSPIDAPQACAFPAMRFPTDLVIERATRLIDFDRNGSDDIIVWGRSSVSGTDTPNAYVILGRPVMNLDCYDYRFSLSAAADLLDVWVGELTDDVYPDIVLFADAGTDYLFELYRGREMAGVDPRITKTVPDDMFPQDIGGSPVNRAPAFVTGFKDTNMSGLVFGGTMQPYGVVIFDTGTLGDGVPLGDTAIGATFPALEPSEYVWAHPFGTAPHDELIVATTDGHLRLLQHDDTDDVRSHFELPDAPTNVNTNLHGGGRNRTVRAWNHPFAGDSTIAATEGGVDSIAIVVYRTFVGPGQNGFASLHLTNGLDFADNYIVYDFGFGNLDGSRSEPLDVVSLTGAVQGMQRRLNVHRNLDFMGMFAASMGGEPGLIGEEESLQTTMVSGYTLAIGNFDGVGNTPDQIVVLGAPTASGTLGTCFQIVQVTSTSCIAHCGATTCL